MNQLSLSAVTEDVMFPAGCRGSGGCMVCSWRLQVDSPVPSHPTAHWHQTTGRPQRQALPVMFLPTAQTLANKLNTGNLKLRLIFLSAILEAGSKRVAKNLVLALHICKLLINRCHGHIPQMGMTKASVT